MPIVCPTCGTPAPNTARFCERDGTRLRAEPIGESDAPMIVSTAVSANPTVVPPAPAPVGATKTACRCGAGMESIVDGFCAACGRKWFPPRTPLARDHVEKSASPVLGGVTDRGQKHPRNEDDFAVTKSETGAEILVVCDGVSASEEADRASAIAAKTVIDKLSQTGECGDDAHALRAAVFAANAAVCALHRSTPGAISDPPETTLVAAVVRQRAATIAWVGDSRAYWISGDVSAARLLSHDHSWMNEKVDSGEMTEAEAGANRLAHAITRCLGTGESEDSEPTITRFVFPDAGGYLLLCSDGLWNYAPAPSQIAALIHAAPQTEGVAAIARSLVAWANAQGGRDNITVALLAVPDTPPCGKKEILNYELPN